MSEQISPELALVDPDLARVERARLRERAQLEALSGTAVLRRPVEATAPPLIPPPAQAPARRGEPAAPERPYAWLAPALLMVSLLANGLFVAFAVTGGGGEQGAAALTQAGVAPASPAQSTPAPANAAPGSGATASRSAVTTTAAGASTPTRRTRATRTSALPVERSAVVERKLLSLVVRSPAGKLPPALIDRSTGLPKNNLQAVCRRSTDSRSFLCVLRSALQPTAEGVWAQYRPARNGRGSFTWYRGRIP